ARALDARHAGQGVARGVGSAAVDRQRLGLLMMPAGPDVDEEPLVEEGAVQLAHDVQRVVLAGEAQGVVRAAGEDAGTGSRAVLRAPALPGGEVAVAAAGGRRPDDRHADPVVRGEEIGELGDVVVALLVADPVLLAVLDGNEVTVAVPEREGLVVVVAGIRRLEADEEPQLVLDDVAAEGAAEVGDVPWLDPPVDDAGGAGDGAGMPGERSGAEVAPHGAVELVTARLGDGA